VRKSMHPSCPAESTLYKKRRRFITWNSKPAIMVSDLLKCKAVATKSREEFASLERDEERWAECFEIARHKLNSSLATCREKNNRLRAESKHLYELVVQECGPGLSVRKRRASQMRDILEELDDRQMQLEGSIEEYEKIAQSAATNGNGTKDGDSAKVNGAHAGAGRGLPIVHMTIDELDYPEDFPQFLTTNEIDEAKKRASQSDASGNVKISGAQSRRDVRAKKLKKSKLLAGNGDSEDKNAHLEMEDEEDSDGGGGEFGRGGNVAEFCAMFAAVDGAVRLGEASLADLDPFFSDDEGEDVTQLVASKGSSKGASQGKGSSSSTKSLTASQKAATLRAASTWDTYAEYQKECKLAEPFSLPKGKNECRDTHWAQCVADASQCPDLVRSGSAHQSALLPRTRFARGAGSGAVNLSAFAVSRTPRGVPLIISPLSQYEDMYLGAVCGALTGAGSSAGALPTTVSDPLTAPTDSIIPVAAPSPSPMANSKGSFEKDKDKDKDKEKKMNATASNTSGVIKDEIARLLRQDAVAVHVTVQLPANLIAAEDAAMERCRLQSLAAAAENKIKRLRSSNIEWCRQAFETAQSLQRSKALFSQAHKDDLMESKIIRRELITYGIVAPKDTDPPLSPVGEYAPHAVAHGVGKGKGGGGPVNRKGVRSIRGLNFAVANAALLSNSPTPPLAATFPGNTVVVDSHVEAPVAIGFTEVAGIDEEGGSFVDDVSIADIEGSEAGGENDANTISHSSSQETSASQRGKEKVKSKVAKSKSVLRVKEEDADTRIDNGTHFEDEELGVGDSMSAADSPMNNGAKKRGAAKINLVGSSVASETAGAAANLKRRGNGSNGGAARKR
jgi:hypothetical protein